MKSRIADLYPRLWGTFSIVSFSAGAMGAAGSVASRRAHGVRTAMLAVAVISLAASLGGCGDAGSETPSTAGEPVGDLTEAPATPAGADDVAGTLPPASGSPDTVPIGPVLAVDGEGLRVFDAATGAARPIPFGTPEGDVMATLSALAGGPPREAGENPDCGVAYATWTIGLSVTFTNDRFAGWSIRAGDGAPSTASGVGVGSTRREIESVYDARFAETSLGTEFSAGALAGVLDSPGGDGRVIAMWAGHVCLAR